MAGEPENNLHGSLPLRLFIQAMLIGSFFSFYIGSADPWWRVKEWVVLGIGSLWLACRTFAQPIQRRVWSSKWLGFLLGWVVVQMFMFHIWPVITASRTYATSPWPWLTFLQIIVISIWMTDSIRMLSKRDMEVIHKTIAWIGLIMSVYMIFQAAGLDPVIAHIQRTRTGFEWLHGNHVIGLAGNPFQAGTILAVTVPAMLTLFHPIVMVLPVLALLATQSASAISAGFMGIGVILLLSKKFRLFGLLCLVSIGAVIYATHHGLLLENGRFLIWKQSIQAWLKAPWDGIGLSMYKLLGVVDDRSGVMAVRWAHNEWIQALAELGLIGLTLLGGWVLGLLWKLRKWRAIPFHWIGTGLTCLALTVLSIPWHLAPTVIVSLLCVIGWNIYSEDLA